jgi:hypothetical protein
MRGESDIGFGWPPCLHPACLLPNQRSTAFVAVYFVADISREVFISSRTEYHALQAKRNPLPQ